jgi:hypothetical protein
MSSSLFRITPTPPTSLAVKVGEQARFSFTVISLAAPDKLLDLQLQAQRVDDAGNVKETDWLIAEPASLKITGGKTETAAISLRPRSTTPLGNHVVKLVIADREQLHEVLGESPTVACEVLAAVKPPPSPARKRWWLIAAIAGAVLVLGGGALAWALWPDPPPGEGQRCATGDPPCAGPLLCDPTSNTCMTTLPACKAGDLRCEADGKTLDSCAAGAWSPALCPASAPQCRDGACQCAADRGQPCGCGGTVQCDGTCSAAACATSCVDGKCCVAKLDAACGGCGGKVLCDGTCSKPSPPELGKPCNTCGGTVQCDGSCSSTTPGNVGQTCNACGGKVQCDGSCSPALRTNFDQMCNACGGKVQCDGSCSPAPPGNLGQTCNACGGKVQCDGSCPALPAGFNQPCGECGGSTQCDGRCSNTMPRCPSGFVVDNTNPSRCVTTSEVRITNPMSFSFGGAVWDHCDPCGGPLNLDKDITLSCGAGRSPSTLSINKVGGTGSCTATWLHNSPSSNDCSVRIHVQTSWLDNVKCDLFVGAVTRRPICTP